MKCSKSLIINKFLLFFFRRRIIAGIIPLKILFINYNILKCIFIQKSSSSHNTRIFDIFTLHVNSLNWTLFLLIFYAYLHCLTTINLIKDNYIFICDFNWWEIIQISGLNFVLNWMVIWSSNHRNILLIHICIGISHSLVLLQVIER